jgi:hypothetical protein
VESAKDVRGREEHGADPHGDDSRREAELNARRQHRADPLQFLKAEKEFSMAGISENTGHGAKKPPVEVPPGKPPVREPPGEPPKRPPGRPPIKEPPGKPPKEPPGNPPVQEPPEEPERRF